MNIKLSAQNNSKVSVLGKCSLTLKHKKDYFDVSFIAVDSFSSLNLIKHISAVNVSDFSDCFRKHELSKMFAILKSRRM